MYFSRPSARSSVFVLRSANSLATRALRLMTAAMPRADSDGTTGPSDGFDVANVRRERTPAGEGGWLSGGNREKVFPAKVRYERETPETRPHEASERPRRAFATPNESSSRIEKARGE